MEVRFQGETVESWRSEGRPERLIVFLHGSGDSGPGVAEWLDSLGARAMVDHKTAIFFPSAIERPYSLAGGESSRVWHDRRELNISAWEDQEGIARMAGNLDTFISQGGHMSLQAVFGHRLEVAACFALSSFLCSQSSVFQALSSQPSSRTPLFLSTGSEDTMVDPGWVETTRSRLSELGVTVSHSLIHGLDHQMEATQLQHLFQWINDKYP